MSDVRSHRPDSLITPPVVAWLERHADAALRLLVAPPGFGKTTALRAYAARSGRRQAAVGEGGRVGTQSLAAAIAGAVDFAEPADLILDDLHLADAGALAALTPLVAALPPHVRIIAASQRRDVVDVGALFARGLIAVCDQSALAFDLAGAREVFTGANIAAPDAALDDLIARTDGWPPAIVGTAREIVREPQGIGAAYEGWQRAWALPATDLVDALLERVPAAEQAAARRHFADGAPLDQSTLAVLHRCGFFVRFAAGTYALMGWVDELFAAARLRADRPILQVQLFGRFAAAVDGVRVTWARRRDQHIVKYLLLRPDGAATRSQLADVFWPDTARPQAMQNLRTACSTIRRAIGNVVGIENVDAYFVAGDRLALNRATIACDVERFRRHVAYADADEAAGAASDAIAHLRAAEQLYGHGLFAGDVSEPVFYGESQELAAIYARVLTRLGAALIERGSLDLARAYAAKAHKLGLLPGVARRPQVDLRVAAS